MDASKRNLNLMRGCGVMAVGLLLAPHALGQQAGGQYPGYYGGAAVQTPAQQPAQPAAGQPNYRLAQAPSEGATHQQLATANSPNIITQTAPGEHPLMPALRWAHEGVERIRQIQDYSCTMYKRERVGGVVGDYQAMYVKVRHQPFSVYMYFLSPTDIKGQEVIWVKGLNENKLQAHAVGIKNVVGTVSLNPTGQIAMRGNRYPITEVGILNLVERLIQVGEKDAQYGECEVRFQKAKIGGRPATCIQVVHPVPRRNFLFNQARIFVDDELNLPIRYESYSWPSQPGGQPELLEEYTYQNFKLNNGFTDQDFDTRNPKYGFR
ncbi:MAG: DUF1571 domain-containing protein [Pirellulales bacterium]